MPVASGPGHLAAQVTTTQAASKAVAVTLAAGGTVPPSARHVPTPPALSLPTPPRSSDGLGSGAWEAMPVASGPGHLAAQVTTTQAATKTVAATLAAGGMVPSSARRAPAPPALSLPTPPRSSDGLGSGAGTLQDDLAAVGVPTE